MKDTKKLGLGLAMPDRFVCAGAQHQLGSGVYTDYSRSEQCSNSCVVAFVYPFVLVARDLVFPKILVRMYKPRNNMNLSS